MSLRGLKSNFFNEGPWPDGGNDARSFKRDSEWIAPWRPEASPEEMAEVARMNDEFEKAKALLEDRDCAFRVDVGPLLEELCERHGIDPSDPNLEDLLAVDEVMEEWLPK